ncbi:MULTISPECIES: erythromycin esterase family protein [unclassified Kitasatospora]|uniref:erythromycin esterase family protein n=1 Tax=unclassified Kitasatospora TaxID=2633591 RepID=UPI0033EF0EAB
MTARGTHIGRRSLLAATAAMATTALFAPATVAAADQPPDRSADATQRQSSAVVGELDAIAYPLRSTEAGGRETDLRALGAMIGDATMVGLGEATHGTHEFFTMKQRVLRYLVEEKGFTAFALETSWSSGLRVDDYVQGRTGGDARRLVQETMGGSPWDRQEFADLIDWMRSHNREHPGRPVHFVGDDLDFPSIGDQLFDRVTGYVRDAAPESLPRLEQLYAGLRPFDDAITYLTTTPLAERRTNAAVAQRTLELVTAAEGGGGEAYEWALQNARSIAQTFAFTAVDLDDPADLAEKEHFRDRAMTDNALWWQRRTGSRMLLSAHNGHVGYRSSDPVLYPRTQGSYLRDALGAGYLSIGFTFDRGSFLTKDAPFAPAWKKVTVPPATADMNEYTLDRVRHRDYYVDLRSAPPATRAWLGTARPTYDAGTEFRDDPLPRLAIGPTYDALIHLHATTEARPTAQARSL